MKFLRIILVAAALMSATAARAAGRGDSVVVVYNLQMPESKMVAEHYRAARHVPASQVLGLNLPMGEDMSRQEYDAQLEGPLRDFLAAQRLLVFQAIPHSTNGGRKLVEERIRYAVLCYGVPLRIDEDPRLAEPEEKLVLKQLRNNGAAVDSELSLLPWPAHHMLTAFVPNPCYGATNPALIDPSNGVLIVSRLDGPTAAIASGLVDKAMEAETNGLWGRAYFDLRHLDKKDPLRKGDDWIGTAALAARQYGFETVVDDNPKTFSAGFPMSQIALYAGWYDWDVSGPFAQPQVEFMPGAFAYHLHSFSAQTLRSTTKHWCGPLLADGATATMGCVNEPYLDGTPNMAFFFTRWLSGLTYGEAACAAQGALSWQTTVIGDPLYRPFGQDPRRLHEALAARHSPMLAWSHVRVVNLSLLHRVPIDKLIGYIQEVDPASQSCVLTEKLGDLYQMAGRSFLALDTWQNALKLNPTPQQFVRLTMESANELAQHGQKEQALAMYESFLAQTPDYPDALLVYQAMEKLAKDLQRRSQAERYEREIARLSSSPAK